jgi:DNA replication protein DnaC
MTKSRAKVGERLPYLLGKLKAPRVLQRLEQTAELARAEQWPYEQFLETLLEAEVFARDASGARMRVRHASFPALKTLEDFDWTAQPAVEKPLLLHLAPLAWIEERATSVSSARRAPARRTSRSHWPSATTSNTDRWCTFRVSLIERG